MQKTMQMVITDAAKKLYSKIDDIISYEYGVGNYNLELVYKSICQTLEAQLSDPDRELCRYKRLNVMSQFIVLFP